MEIKIRELCKSYGKKKALQNFDATFENGIYGILGPNGAGKSTLMNILTDNLLRDSGRILCGGKDIYRKSLGYMPQQQQLYETFTVTEFLAYMGTLKGMKKKEIRARMELLFPLLNLDKVKRKKIKELSGGMKQRVLLLQALLNDPKILILDEPTASLSDKETNLLFSIVRNLKAKGTSVLYVTHRLEEIMELTDRVTVLRNGTLVSTVDTAGTSRKELVRLMSGNEAASGVEDAETGKDAEGKIGKTALEVHGIRSKDGIVRGVDLNVKSGQITGMFGLCGSGRTEFLECIYGTRKLAGGEVMIDGKTTTRPTPSESIRQGIAFICEDRRGKAMIPAFSVEENMMLSSIDRYTKSGWFQKRAADKKARDMIEALKIKCVGVSQPAKELSGGNQQKVVFAKALLTEPSIWLCDEPTQAVDVATRQEIHRLLREEAKKGKAVLYVSSDLTELLEVADEVAVMAYGRVRKTFENKDLKPTDVLACCYEAEREESD